MELPVLNWEYCFQGNWCYLCGDIQELKITPSANPQAITKHCLRCDTTYTLNIPDTFNPDHRVILPDNFILPTANKLEEIKRNIIN